MRVTVAWKTEEGTGNPLEDFECRTAHVRDGALVMVVESDRDLVERGIPLHMLAGYEIPKAAKVTAEYERWSIDSPSGVLYAWVDAANQTHWVRADRKPPLDARPVFLGARAS